ncbi:MAG TPA: phosphatidate cytidylyltransferase [Actinomycetota bacterium]|nr:phosphatidate cytidylyltransferase [Actinomycetota bacterium]
MEATEAAPPRAGRSLGQAVLTAVILVGLLVGSFLLGRIAFFVLVTLLVMLALYELVQMLRSSGRAVFPPIPLAAGFGLLLLAYLRLSEYFAIVLFATMFLSFIAALRPDRGPHPGSDVAWSLLAPVWVGGGGAGAVSILMLPGGRLLLVAFIVVVVLGDIGAYFVGVERGRHKIAPSISPAKSWEGFAAGVLSSFLAGTLVASVLLRVSLLEGLGLGLVCAIFGPAGDLVESLVKREIGTKDSSHLLPGHGGMLDRLDAIAFSAVPAYLFLRFIVL